jgi:hypothetical protein
MLDVSQAQAIAEQFIRQEMRERHCSATAESVEVESVEIDFKRVQLQRLSCLVQAIATETVSRWVVVTRKGLINWLLRRRTQRVQGRNIMGHIVRFQLRIDADSGNILTTDIARGKGGTIDPFFDMKRI